MTKDAERPTHETTVVIAHRPRDEAIIIVLLFICVVFFMTQASDINLVQELENVFRGWIAQPATLVKSMGLLLAGVAYLSLIYDNRRVEFENALLLRQVGFARERAYTSLEELERVTAQFEDAAQGRS